MEQFILKEVLSIFPQADPGVVSLAIETARGLGLEGLDPFFLDQVVEIYLELVRSGWSNMPAAYFYTPPANVRATQASKPPKQARGKTPPPPKVAKEQPPPPPPKVANGQLPPPPRIFNGLFPPPPKVAKGQPPPPPPKVADDQLPPPPKVAKGQPPPPSPKVAKGQNPPPPPKVAKGQPPPPPKVANGQLPLPPKVSKGHLPPPPKVAKDHPPPPPKFATAQLPPPAKVVTAQLPPPIKTANVQPVPPLKLSLGLPSPHSKHVEVTRGLVSLQNPSASVAKGAVQMDILLPYMSANEALEALENDGKLLACSSCSRGTGTLASCTGSHNICQECLKAAAMNVIQLGLAHFSCPVPGCTGEILIDSLGKQELPFSVGLFREHIRRATLLGASDANVRTELDVRCLRCGCTTQLYLKTMMHKCTNKECLLEFRFSGKSESKDVADKKRPSELNPAQFAGIACLTNPDLSPLHWAKFTKSEYLKKGFLLVPLSPASLEFNEVARFYSKTAKHAVKMVHRIQNKTVWASYVKKRMRMVPILGDEELNEKFMFHGISKEAVDNIYSKGFDFLNRSHNHKLDKGISFSNKAWIAELYTKQQNSTLVLIAAVLAGSRVDWRQPIYLHDSCVHKKPNPFEVIVFSNDQCCPAYVVEVVVL